MIHLRRHTKHHRRCLLFQLVHLLPSLDPAIAALANERYRKVQPRLALLRYPHIYQASSSVSLGTGLHNFSVTCYMNATIQCLSATIPMTAFFIDGQYQKSLQRDNWKGSKGIMPEYYNILLRNLWQSNEVDIIRPTNFRVCSVCVYYTTTNIIRNSVQGSITNGVQTGNKMPRSF